MSDFWKKAKKNKNGDFEVDETVELKTGDRLNVSEKVVVKEKEGVGEQK